MPTPFARRRRLSRPESVGVAVVVVAAVGLAAWFAVGGPDRQGVRAAGPSDCPPGPGSSPPPRDGLDRHLVPVLPLPVGPVGATLCRYPARAGAATGSGGSGGATGSGGAAGSGGSGGAAGVVLDATRTAEVAGWLDVGGVPVGPGAEGTCPADDGSALVITFRYAEGPDARVTVHTSGCKRITNGVRTEQGRPDLVTELDALISAG